MKFEFRLQKLLEYREQLKKEAEQAYQEALSNVALAEEELKEIEQSIVESFNYIGQAIHSNDKKLKMGLASQAENYIRGQKYQARLQNQSIHELKLIVEQKREKLTRLAVDFHALEKVREKKYEEFKQKEKKKEAQKVDELVTMRFRRNNF